MEVYKTTNLVNGKIYIGQTRSSNKKYLKYYMGSGRIIISAIKKYGCKNFIRETICECSSQDELNCMEKYWIEKLDSKNSSIGYNIANGGLESGYFDNETIELISTNSKNRVWVTNGKDSEKFVKKDCVDQYVNVGWLMGRLPNVDQFGIKVVRSLRDKKSWAGGREKIPVVSIGKNGDILEEFESIKSAARFYGMKTDANIQFVLSGKRRSAGTFNGEKLKWKRVGQ